MEGKEKTKSRVDVYEMDHVLSKCVLRILHDGWRILTISPHLRRNKEFLSASIYFHFQKADRVWT